MCGRYYFDLASDELHEFYKKIQEQMTEEEKIASGEIYPSNHVITLQENEDGEIEPALTRWGFQGFKKNQLLINARSETVEEKKTFSKAFRENRCVFPMTGFYEWNQEKNKFLFTKGQVLYVAGFYRVHHSADENEMESIIMTTQPNTSVAKIHDRMPVIVEKNQVNNWILNLDFARELIKNDMPELKSELAS